MHSVWGISIDKDPMPRIFVNQKSALVWCGVAYRITCLYFSKRLFFFLFVYHACIKMSKEKIWKDFVLRRHEQAYFYFFDWKRQFRYSTTRPCGDRGGEWMRLRRGTAVQNALAKRCMYFCKRFQIKLSFLCLAAAI